MERAGPRLRVNRKRQQVLLSLLRTLREERDLRQDYVARRLGFPQSVVSKYESGERRLDLLELYDLCSVVGISMTGFVRRFERELAREIHKVSTRPSKRKS
jgi:transcriptional regulator with XRE-family HTH domain